MKALAIFVHLALGALFGAALLGTGTSDFDAMNRMFLFQERRLFVLAALTTLVAALGLFWLKRSPFGDGVRFVARPIQRGSVVGGVLFGLGWGLSGSCPGTVLAQLGSGHAVALVTLLGVLLGNLAFDRYIAPRFGLDSNSCS